MKEQTTRPGSAFACVRDDERERRAAAWLRDWERHPELRAQYNNNFDRYVVACRQWK